MLLSIENSVAVMSNEKKKRLKKNSLLITYSVSAPYQVNSENGRSLRFVPLFLKSYPEGKIYKAQPQN